MSLKKLLMAVVSVPLFLSGQALAGVVGTAHDLSTGSGGTEVTDALGDDTQVCAFCHTPHDAATTANQVIPLWNRNLTATTYTSAGSTIYTDNGGGTLSGEVLDLTSGVSMACLSCHDGTIAMDSLLNIPGSGDAWNGGTTADSVAGANITASKISAGSVVNLGTDLSNDHPVAIEYGGGGCTAGAACAAPTDAFIKGTVLSGTQSWVDMDESGTYVAANDLIPLFDRTFAGAVDRPSVECASCHDVHASAGNAAIAGQMLLRVSSTGSAICTACHIK